MPATDKQRAWAGEHITNPAQFRYGSADDYGRLAKIESTVELSAQEVARIEDSIAKYGARFAIVRPAPRDPTHLDVEFRGGRPFERIARVTGYLSPVRMWNDAKKAELSDRVQHGLPNPEEEVNLHIDEEK